MSVSNPSPDSAHSWYLEKMTVKTYPKAEEELVFMSSQWIGAKDEVKEELKTAENDVELLLQGELYFFSFDLWTKVNIKFNW